MKKAAIILSSFLAFTLLSGCAFRSPDYECIRVTPPAHMIMGSPSLHHAKKELSHHSYKQALRDYTLLALSGSAEAQYQLGYMYMYGQGTKKNRSLSRGYFQMAATQGYKKAAQALQLVDRP